jgi:valine--pyruvate aminotransferase
MLLNLFGGAYDDGRSRQVLLPLLPEYIGYADQGLSPDHFRALPARIEEQDGRMFKVRVDLDALPAGEDIGAVALSRPTNPTGNVVTAAELDRLGELAGRRGVPLIVDQAYGAPFPGIVYESPSALPWDEGRIYTFSLSKLGLPGARTGIVVAEPEVIRALAAVNSVVSLAIGSVGPAIVGPMLDDGSLDRLCRDVIRPTYRRKRDRALAWLQDALPAHLPYLVHQPEGAFFLWVWFRDLPISSQALYERLKRRGVLVIPGCHFAYGLDAAWDLPDQCLRVTYAAAEDDVQKGIGILGEEVAAVYAGR